MLKPSHPHTITCAFLRLLCVLTIIFAGLPANAQSGGGSIQGTISDPTGAVVANAIVSARNIGTGLVTARKSTGAGLYDIGPLQVGEYTVTVISPGFGTRTQEHIQVDGLAVVSLNVALTPGADVTITVTAASLNQANGTVGDTVASQDYQLLPLVMNSAPRSPVAFVNLANGVDASRGYNGGAVNYQ
jgi:hypothetical protein